MSEWDLQNTQLVFFCYLFLAGIRENWIQVIEKCVALMRLASGKVGMKGVDEVVKGTCPDLLSTDGISGAHGAPDTDQSAESTRHTSRASHHSIGSNGVGGTDDVGVYFLEPKQGDHPSASNVGAPVAPGAPGPPSAIEPIRTERDKPPASAASGTAGAPELDEFSCDTEVSEILDTIPCDALGSKPIISEDMKLERTGKTLAAPHVLLPLFSLSLFHFSFISFKPSFPSPIISNE